MAVTQAAEWNRRHFGEELNGRQCKRIAQANAEIALPYLKVAIFRDMADALADFAPVVEALNETLAEFMKTLEAHDGR